MKKKILFLIYSSSVTSGGGHFYSLLTLINELSNDIEFKVINAGEVHAMPLKNNKKFSSTYIPVFKKKYFKDIKKVKTEILKFEPNVIHAFDLNSLRVARTLNFKKIPVIFSKCGGINGSKIIPHTDAYICFSKENKIHLNRYKKNSNPIYLIPNRASKIEPDIERGNSLISNLGLKNESIFLRISRFSSDHELSIIQSVDLFKLYHAKNKNTHLIIIGIIQDENVYKKIVTLTKGYSISIITENYYCNNASSLLYLADVVISTGRGVMESASLGKPIFCPLKGSKYPVAFNESNYELLSKFNFSGRTEGLKITKDEILNIIDNDLENMGEFSSQMFKINFDIKAVKNIYLGIYDNTKKTKKNIRVCVNYLLDMLIFFKPNF